MYYMIGLLSIVILSGMTGILFENACELKTGGEKLIGGYILLFAGMHLICLPFMLFSLSYNILKYSISMFAIVILVLSVRKLGKAEHRKRTSMKVIISKYTGYIFQMEISEKICFALSVILIAYTLIFAATHVSVSSDDGYYIAEMLNEMGNESICTDFPVLGDKNGNFVPLYRMESFEMIISIVCSIFALEPALFCHTFLPLLMLTFHYAVVFLLGRRLSEENKFLFLFVYIVLNLFGGVTQTPANTLTRMWQGKSLIPNILLPLLFLVFLDIMEKKSLQKKHIFQLTAFMIYSMHASVVSIYLFPIAYMCLCLSYLSSRRKKLIKDAVLLCIPMVLMLPFAVLGFILTNQNGVLLASWQDTQTFSWMSTVKGYNNANQLYLYAAAAFFLFIFGRRKKGSIFLLYPFFLFATFLNPFAADFVAVHVTSVQTYWRLLWLLPCSAAIAYGAILIFRRIKAPVFKLVALVILIFIFAKAGTPSFFIYTEMENWYKLEQSVIDITDYLITEEKEEIHILVRHPESLQYRQYSKKIKLLYAKESYMTYSYLMHGRQQEYKNLKEIFHIIFTREDVSEELVEKSLKELAEYELDYLVLPEERYKKMREFALGLSCVFESDGMVLLKYEY